MKKSIRSLYVYIIIYLKNITFKGIVINENKKELSPSEQRALNAEKKAAWRQARLKSLEQVITFIFSLYIEY